MAILHRGPAAGLLFHSDRGVQYAAGDFRAALAQAGLIPSMSRRGNCYDNAAMESFWSTLKIELVYRRVFTTHRQAKTEIFDSIESFYNRQRIHTSLGGLRRPISNSKTTKQTRPFYCPFFRSTPTFTHKRNPLHGLLRVTSPSLTNEPGQADQT